MEQEIGKVRLYAMRLVFFLTFIGLGPSTLTYVFTFDGVWNPLEGVAMAFWSALSLLALIGVLYPMKMLPLLLLQFLYKLIWLISVGWSLYSQGQVDEYTKDLMMANGIGVVLDIVVIPWIFIAKHYFTKVRL